MKPSAPNGDQPGGFVGNRRCEDRRVPYRRTEVAVRREPLERLHVSSEKRPDMRPLPSLASSCYAFRELRVPIPCRSRPVQGVAAEYGGTGFGPNFGPKCLGPGRDEERREEITPAVKLLKNSTSRY
jgi:hypothetical protein